MGNFEACRTAVDHVVVSGKVNTHVLSRSHYG